jgi:hypothetical protein
MAVLRQTVRLLRQSSSGVPSGVMVACVSWRALGGRTAGVRALAFLPSQVLLPCRHGAWRMANARTAWSSGCASKSVGTRKSSSYLARRLATAGLQLAAVMMMCIRIIQRCTWGRSVPTLALRRASSSYRPTTVLARKCSKCCQLFRAFRGRAFLRGMVQPYFSVGSLGYRRVIKRWRHVSVLTQWAGSSGISWCIRSLVKKTLHCRRAGFEPQRTSSFRKRVRAHQVLGEAVRARTTIPHFVLTL